MGGGIPKEVSLNLLRLARHTLADRFRTEAVSTRNGKALAYQSPREILGLEALLTVSTAQPPMRVLQAPESLGLTTREAFRASANALLDEMAEGAGQLVVDLGGTREVDSSGLGALVMVQHHAAVRRQAVVLRGVGAELEFLLVLTKLDDLFVFAPSGG